MSYPNQKIITVGQRPRRDKENLFATVNIEALREAMQRLNGNSGLLLWLYLDKNADGYRLELSQKACEAWGIKRDSYYRAVKELQDKGYLQETGGGRFIFHEVSTAQEATGDAAAAQAEDLPREAAEAAQEATGTGGGAIVSSAEIAKAENLSDFAREQEQKQERNITDNTYTNTQKGIQEATEAEARAADRAELRAYPPPEAEKREAEALEVCGIIPAHIFDCLLEPVTDMGGGLVRLHNGKVYRLEAGQVYHVPRAAIAEAKRAGQKVKF